MRTRILSSFTVMLGASLVLTQAASKDDVSKAIKELADAGSYSWKATSENTRFNMGPTVGKVNRDGLIVVSRTWGDNTFQTVQKGDKAAMETQEGWRSLEELEAEQGDNRGRFMARMLRNLRAPVAEATHLLKSTAALALAEGAYSGTLSEEGVKDMLSLGRRAGGEGPEVSGAKGTVKFWIDKGMLKKYQYAIAGTISWNNQDREMDRTVTVEISNVGSTTVEVPEGARGKL